ncbi:MAG: hypothetical protein IPK93_02440 [Solirubrobacterales bacterium]|nr:hypothetical protein [Solirubrobacterales bacterium]
MSNNQVLQAPMHLVDAWEADAVAMISGHVLVKSGPMVAFLHETFFDYAFARRFVSRQGTVKDLLASDQLLFRRAQLRQILAHERLGDPTSYLRDLEYVVTSEDVRFHLKDSVAAWLGTHAPSEDEWSLISPLLENTEDSASLLLWRVLQSKGWWDLAEEKGRIDEWLSQDSTTEQVLFSLPRVEGLGADRIADLLGPFVGESEAWNQRISRLLGTLDISNDRSLFDLYLKVLMARGEFDPNDFPYVGHELPKKQPGWACELLVSYLEGRLDPESIPEPESIYDRPGRLNDGDSSLFEFIVDIAKSDAVAFIDSVWPVLLTYIEASANDVRPDEPKSLRRDPNFSEPHFSDGSVDLAAALLTGTQVAFSELGKSHADRFRKEVEEVQSTDLEAVVYFIYQGFRAAPEAFADEAIEFVLASGGRLRVGYSDYDHWETRVLVAAVAPFASQELLDGLVSEIVEYYPFWERTSGGRKHRGRAQFELLGGLVPAGRSTPALKRFSELQRKFNMSDASGPSLGIQDGFGGPPIHPASAKKMSNENWIQAVASYSGEGSHPKDFGRGGAYELSSVMRQESKLDPSRFCELVTKLPDDTNYLYFDAVLQGVAESETEVDSDDLRSLLAKCHQLPDRPCGEWIGGPLVRNSSKAAPADLLEILGWYAINGLGPGTDDDGEEGEEERLESRGRNSVRGAAAVDIARLVNVHEENFQPLGGAIAALVSDESLAVRAVAAQIPLFLIRFYPTSASEFFHELVSIDDDRIFEVHGVNEYLRYRGASDFESLGEVIERMLGSDREEVQVFGSVQAILASLDEEAATELASRAIAGNQSQRLGAAQVFAANLTTARFTKYCENGLINFFDDDSAEVREAASKAVHRLDGDDLETVEELASSFLESAAFQENQEALILAIDRTTASVPELTVSACRKVLSGLPEGFGKGRPGSNFSVHRISKVIFRAYADSPSDVVRNEALDLIDKSLEMNLYGTEAALVGFDRASII